MKAKGYHHARSKSELNETHEVYKDYEKRVQAYQKQAEKIPQELLKLFLFPKDNFQVVKKKIKRNEGEASGPKKADEDTLPLFSRKVIEFLKSKEVGVKYKYKEFTKIATKGLEFKRPKFEIDQKPGKEEECEIKQDKKLVVNNVKKTRKRIRQRIDPHFMYLYDNLKDNPEFDWNRGVEVNLCKRTPYQERRNLNEIVFLLHVKGFKTRFGEKFGDTEPLFLTFALYDAKEKRRISENFHCDLNKDDVVSMIKRGGIVREKTKPTNIRTGIFHIDLPEDKHSDVVMVCTLSKVLEGVEEEVSEKFISPEKFGEDAVKKWSKNVKVFCERLGFLRQPIAYTMMEVFLPDEDGTTKLILGKEKEKKYTFYRTQGNVPVEAILGLDDPGTRKSMTGTRKIKSFQVEMKLEALRLSTDYNPIFKFQNIISVNNKLLAKEIKTFPPPPSPDDDLRFNQKYKHILYLYPRSISFPTKIGKSPKNIVCRIQVKDNDKNVNDTSLKCIYGQSSQDLLVDEYYTRVTVGKKNPQFGDEIKIELPVNITNKHHILFSFFNVNIKLKGGGKKNKSELTEIAHAMVFLIDRKGKLLKGSQDCELFNQKKNTAYFGKNKKKGGTLRVRFVPDSTLYPTQRAMATAFHKPTKKIRALLKAYEKDMDYFVQNLPPVFSMLHEQICSTKDNKVASETFKTYMLILKKIKDTFYEQGVEHTDKLKKYVELHFKNPKDKHCKSGFPFYRFILLWHSLLKNAQEKRRFESSKGKGDDEETEGEGEEDDEMFHYNNIVRCIVDNGWFVFEIIVKSITLYIQLEKKNRLFDKAFNKVMGEFIVSYGKEVCFQTAKLTGAKCMNRDVALFLKYLMNVMDRGQVLIFIDKYLHILGTTSQINENVLQDFRMTFLTIISDYEHFVPMSLPKKRKVSSGSYEGHLTDLSFLCGIVIRQCVFDLCSENANVRDRVFNLLKSLITKHEFDERYSDEESKKLIFSMFFPLILYLVELYPDYKRVSGKVLNKAKEDYDNVKRDYSHIQGKIEDKKTNLEDLKKNEETQRGQIEKMVEDLQEELEGVKKILDERKEEYEKENIRARSEYQQILYIIITIIHNMDRSILYGWFKSENAKRINQFIAMMMDVLVYFEYRGREQVKKDMIKYGVKDQMSAEQTVKNAIETIEEIYKGFQGPGARSRRSLQRSVGPNSPAAGAAGSFRRPMLVRRTIGRTVGRGSPGSPASPASPASDGGGSDSAADALAALASSTPGAGGTASVGGGRPPLGRMSYRGSMMNRTLGRRKKEDDVNEKVVEHKVKWEGIVSSQTSMVVLDVLIDLVRSQGLKNASVVDKILLGLCGSFFDTYQSHKVMVYFFDFMISMLELYRPKMYLNETPYSERFCLSLLKKAFSPLSEIRDRATAVLYVLIMYNFREMGNFTRTKTQTTTALASLVKDLEERHVSCLKNAFTILADYSEHEKVKSNTMKRKRTKDGGGFSKQVAALVQRLKMTLDDSRKITYFRKHKYQGEKLVELYIRLAHGNRDAPELCVTWYSNLSEYHRRNERYVEAGQCICLMAGYVFQYLKLKEDKEKAKKKGPTGIFSRELHYGFLQKCTPWLKDEKSVFRELHNLFREGDPTFASSFFTVEGFLKLVNQAKEFFEKAKYYEYKLFINKLLLQYNEFFGNYSNLSSNHLELSKDYELLSKIGMDNRLFGSYYFIGFYGAKLGSENGAEYIYKFPKISKLRDVIVYSTRLFEGVPGVESDNIKIKPSSFTVEESHRNDPEDIFVKIISLDPVPHPDRKNSTTYFDRHENIDTFIFESPFTKTGKKGKAHSRTLEDQWKRKVLMITEQPFPNLDMKMKIKRKDIRELTPIENSTEIITSSIEKLKLFSDPEEVKESSVDDTSKKGSSSGDFSDFDVNGLQLVLSGTVIPQVQEGIPAIIKIFLTEKYEKDPSYDPLKKRFRQFLKYNLKGIRLNDKFKSHKGAALHGQFIEGYKKLYGMITLKVDGCERYKYRDDE